MQEYIGRTNVDHCLGLLNGCDLTPHSRRTITKLLIAEEDKLSRDLEQLEFAESRAASGRERVIHVRSLRDVLAPGTSEREQAERLLTNLENCQILLEDFARRLREQVNSHGSLSPLDCSARTGLAHSQVRELPQCPRCGTMTKLAALLFDKSGGKPVRLFGCRKCAKIVQEAAPERSPRFGRHRSP